MSTGLAQIVESKFQAARGGILFIDEAYSLVENQTARMAPRRSIPCAGDGELPG